MKIMFLGSIYILLYICFFATSARSDKNCQDKVRSLMSLDVIEYSLSRVKDLFPNCTDAVTNASDCTEKESASAYLDLAKTLVQDIKNNYPTCIDPKTKEPDTTEAVTQEPAITQIPEIVTTKKPRKDGKSQDCYDVLQSGQKKSGVYEIWPISATLPNKSFTVFCDMETDGGGWTVIQRRGKYSPQENFYRDWIDYKYGFGDLKKDFWLGNDNIFIVTNQGKYQVRFDLESAGNEKAYAVYDSFRIENTRSYTLLIESYKGNAGDCMSTYNGTNFYTTNVDNAYTCGTVRKGGWWYDSNCSGCNLNGLYKPGQTERDLIIWFDWKRSFLGLAGSEIKIKPSI